MEKETVTFRLDASKKNALDALAAALDRDRSYVLNQAVGSFLEVNEWQIEHIKEGVRQADAGEFATAAQVRRVFARRRR